MKFYPIRIFAISSHNPQPHTATLSKIKNMVFVLLIRSVYKELHADHETGAADNK